MYRIKNGAIEVLIAHPGGPFWADKDLEAWTIPKGLINENEDIFSAAKREFIEETGITPKATSFDCLGTVISRSGKLIHAWAFEEDNNLENFVSNKCSTEWPKGSNIIIEIPEIDRIEWHSPESAKLKLSFSQTAFVERLCEIVKIGI